MQKYSQPALPQQGRPLTNPSTSNFPSPYLPTQLQQISPQVNTNQNQKPIANPGLNNINPITNYGGSQYQGQKYGLGAAFQHAHQHQQHQVPVQGQTQQNQGLQGQFLDNLGGVGGRDSGHGYGYKRDVNYQDGYKNQQSNYYMYQQPSQQRGQNPQISSSPSIGQARPSTMNSSTKNKPLQMQSHNLLPYGPTHGTFAYNNNNNNYQNFNNNNNSVGRQQLNNPNAKMEEDTLYNNIMNIIPGIIFGNYNSELGIGMAQNKQQDSTQKKSSKVNKSQASISPLQTLLSASNQGPSQLNPPDPKILKTNSTDLLPKEDKSSPTKPNRRSSKNKTQPSNQQVNPFKLIGDILASNNSKANASLEAGHEGHYQGHDPHYVGHYGHGGGNYAQGSIFGIHDLHFQKMLCQNMISLLGNSPKKVGNIQEQPQKQKLQKQQKFNQSQQNHSTFTKYMKQRHGKQKISNQKQVNNNSILNLGEEVQKTPQTIEKKPNLKRIDTSSQQQSDIKDCQNGTAIGIKRKNKKDPDGQLYNKNSPKKGGKYINLDDRRVIKKKSSGMSACIQVSSINLSDVEQSKKKNNVNSADITIQGNNISTNTQISLRPTHSTNSNTNISSASITKINLNGNNMNESISKSYMNRSMERAIDLDLYRSKLEKTKKKYNINADVFVTQDTHSPQANHIKVCISHPKTQLMNTHNPSSTLLQNTTSAPNVNKSQSNIIKSACNLPIIPEARSPNHSKNLSNRSGQNYQGSGRQSKGKGIEGIVKLNSLNSNNSNNSNLSVNYYNNSNINSSSNYDQFYSFQYNKFSSVRTQDVKFRQQQSIYVSGGQGTIYPQQPNINQNLNIKKIAQSAIKQKSSTKSNNPNLNMHMEESMAQSIPYNQINVAYNQNNKDNRNQVQKNNKSNGPSTAFNKKSEKEYQQEQEEYQDASFDDSQVFNREECQEIKYVVGSRASHNSQKHALSQLQSESLITQLKSMVKNHIQNYITDLQKMLREVLINYKKELQGKEKIIAKYENKKDFDAGVSKIGTGNFLKEDELIRKLKEFDYKSVFQKMQSIIEHKLNQQPNVSTTSIPSFQNKPQQNLIKYQISTQSLGKTKDRDKNVLTYKQQLHQQQYQIIQSQVLNNR